jgi:hypothetical protein
VDVPKNRRKARACVDISAINSPRVKRLDIHSSGVAYDFSRARIARSMLVQLDAY